MTTPEAMKPEDELCDQLTARIETAVTMGKSARGIAHSIMPIVLAYETKARADERAKVAEEQDPSTGLTVYSANEKLYGRCETCDEVRWHTEIWRRGQSAIRSAHCGCCTHPHDLEPGGHAPWPARGEA